MTRVEVGYFGATALLCLMLAVVYRRAASQPQSGTPAAAAIAA